MRTASRMFIAALAIACLAAVPWGAARGADSDELAPKLRAALVKVHVTSQGWNENEPWKKASPRTLTQRGVMVRPGLVLTLARGLVNQLMIEVSVANSSVRYPASLVHADSACELALIRIDDEDLAKRMAPLEFGDPIGIDDEFEIWQLGGNELLQRFTGHVQAVQSVEAQLRLTIKTTLADRGDGQVILRDGKVAGLVISTWSGRQEGVVLALETIRHYLEDFDTGEYRGFPGPGTWYLPLLRDDLRALFEVPEDEHGVVVTRQMPDRTGDGELRRGDVLTRVAGHDIDDEGMIEDERHGRLSLKYPLLGIPHAGDKVPVRILRGGEPREIEVTVRKWSPADLVIPPNMNDRRPRYMVVGGLVILELTRRSSVRSEVLREMQDRATWDFPDERKRIVYASRVLPDLANKGLDQIGSIEIVRVNGVTITEITDVAKALETPVDGYHVFEFGESSKNFVIRAAELEAIDRRIADRYRIPELRYLE